MKLENQVISIEQAKRIKELGVIQNGLFSWAFDLLNYRWQLSNHNVEALELIKAANKRADSGSGFYSAFTVSELGVMFGIGTRTTDWLVNVKIDTSTKTLMWRPEFLADCLI